VQHFSLVRLLHLAWHIREDAASSWSSTSPSFRQMAWTTSGTEQLASSADVRGMTDTEMIHGDNAGRPTLAALCMQAPLAGMWLSTLASGFVGMYRSCLPGLKVARASCNFTRRSSLVNLYRYPDNDVTWIMEQHAQAKVQRFESQRTYQHQH
jgi:hypothetical protein